MIGVDNTFLGPFLQSPLALGADLGYSSGHEAALQERWALRMASRYGWSPGPGRLRVFIDFLIEDFATTPPR